MLKRICSFLFLIVFFSMGLQAQAVLKADKTSHNFGKFTEDTPVSCVFVFTNVGDEPLVIQQAMSTCGCTVANYTKTPIQPGEKGELHVTYNGKGKYPGHFKKSISVRSNASNSLARFYIEGDMEESAQKK